MKPLLHSLFLAVCVVAFGTLPTSAEDRVAWTTSRVVGSPEPPKPYGVQRVYPNLEFNSPVELMPLGSTGKMMILEVNGKLLTFDDKEDVTKSDLALDFGEIAKAKNEELFRAFGFGVHPKFDQNRQVFAVYSVKPVARAGGARLSRFTVSKSDPPTIDPQSEEVLLTWTCGGHNGCAIRFDPDGYMYFSAGDGARPYPPDEYDTSQDLSDLRSSICRINVDKRSGDKAYTVPADNPFVDTPNARPEIWAFGFRNPWRFNFVPGTNRILCGDVGWELWELIHDVRRGTNHGWSIFEGPQPIRKDVAQGPSEITRPLVSYPHSIGQSVTGGLVYQGSELPDLKDVYLYGDYVTGLLWGLRPDEQPVTWNPVLAETGLRIITFCESRNKEVLLVDYAGGIHKLVRNQIEKAKTAFPRKLSETGLFVSTETMDPSAGVYPYKLTSHAWQDGATADFVIGLPNTSTVTTHKLQRNWKHPEGAVYIKTLSRNVVVDGQETTQRIETQLLHFDGINWQPYSYVWNDQQTDAELVPAEGMTKDLTVMENGKAVRKSWRISNRAECRTCHTPQTGGAVGFSFENLGLEQVNRFVDLGLLDRTPAKWWKVRYMVNPHDESADLESRARSYLAANCSHCHRRGGGGTVPLDLVYPNTTDMINAVDFAPSQGMFGIKDAKVIQPGDPYRSVLYYRMATGGAGHMPKLWSGYNEPYGLQLIHDWIQSIDPVEQPEIKAGTTESALRDFARLLANDLGKNERATTINRLAGSANSIHVDIVERFLPPDQRRKRLGKDIDVPSILAMKGNAAHGRTRFLAGETQQCIKCHRYQGTGVSVGPDFDGIGKKRTREQLLASILQPSKEIEEKYRTRAIVDDTGVVHTGYVLRENQNFVDLRGADGKITRVNQNEFEAMKTVDASIMPDGLAEQMTAQELADLIAFLDSLK